MANLKYKKQVSTYLHSLDSNQSRCGFNQRKSHRIEDGNGDGFCGENEKVAEHGKSELTKTHDQTAVIRSQKTNNQIQSQKSKENPYPNPN